MGLLRWWRHAFRLDGPRPEDFPWWHADAYDECMRLRAKSETRVVRPVPEPRGGDAIRADVARLKEARVTGPTGTPYIKPRLSPAHIDRERKRDAMLAHRSGTTGPTGPTGPASTTSERIGNYVVNYNYGTHRVALAHVVDNEFQHPVERAPHPQEWPSQEEGKRRTRYTGPK